MLKKTALTALAVVLSGATLAACGGKSDGKSGDTAQPSPSAGQTAAASAAPKTPPTIEMSMPLDPGASLNSDTWSIKEWGARTGVTFNVTTVPRESQKEKLNLAIASNEFPELTRFFQDDTTYKKYGAKLFVALDPYLADGKLPNFQKYLKKYPDVEKAIRNPADGKIYGFPLVQDFEWVPRVWWMRNDLLKKQGMDAGQIKSLDDVKAAMLALQKENGGKPITSSRLGWSYYFWTASTPFGLAGENNGKDPRYNPDTKKFEYGPTAAPDRFKLWVEFERWMYENKLLSPDFLTMKDNDLFAGYASGSFPLIREQNTASSAGATNEALMEPVLPFPVAGKIQTQVVSPHYNTNFRGPWVISNKSKNADAIVKALDWLYSDEGITTMFLGKEGEHWAKDSKTPSGYKITGFQSVWTAGADGKQPAGLKTGGDLGLGNWWLNGVIPEFNRYGMTSAKEGEDAKAKKYLNSRDAITKAGGTSEAAPAVSFDDDALKKATELGNQIETYTSENAIKFIIGQKSMSDWDSFMAGYKSLKIDDWVKLYNDAAVK
ncbi:MAG: extracellular solute-binding protein [Paenibacillaceae bacterium]|nr:extracellular solute-binding protein [Paenibacillaceae bacterium]